MNLIVKAIYMNYFNPDYYYTVIDNGDEWVMLYEHKDHSPMDFETLKNLKVDCMLLMLERGMGD